MKKLVMLTPFLLLATPALAQSEDKKSPAVAPAPANWLDERTLLSVDTVLMAMDTKATPEQKAEIQNALLERNNAVAAANAKLSLVLQKSLAVEDGDVPRKLQEAARMDQMRRAQPMRYEHLRRQKGKLSK